MVDRNRIEPSERVAKQKRYGRKNQLAQRYQTSTRTIDRMAADGRLPKPIYLPGSNFPLWDLEEIEAVERSATRQNSQPQRRQFSSHLSADANFPGSCALLSGSLAHEPGFFSDA